MGRDGRTDFLAKFTAQLANDLGVISFLDPEDAGSGLHFALNGNEMAPEGG